MHRRAALPLIGLLSPVTLGAIGVGSLLWRSSLGLLVTLAVSSNPCLFTPFESEILEACVWSCVRCKASGASYTSIYLRVKVHLD